MAGRASIFSICHIVCGLREREERTWVTNVSFWVHRCGDFWYYKLALWIDMVRMMIVQYRVLRYTPRRLQFRLTFYTIHYISIDADYMLSIDWSRWHAELTHGHGPDTKHSTLPGTSSTRYACILVPVESTYPPESVLVLVPGTRRFRNFRFYP